MKITFSTPSIPHILFSGSHEHEKRKTLINRTGFTLALNIALWVFVDFIYAVSFLSTVSALCWA